MVGQDTKPQRPRAIVRREVSQSAVDSEAAVATLYEIAVPRYQSLVAVFVMLWSVFSVGGVLVLAGVVRLPSTVAGPGVFFTIAAVAFAAAAGMVAVTRMPWPARRIVNLGIGFQILGTFLFAAVEEWSRRPGGLPITAVWVLSFTLVPQSLRRAKLAVMGSAFAPSIAIIAHGLLGHRSDNVFASAGMSIGAHVVFGLIPLYTNKVMYRLGRQVESAKQLGAYQIVDKLGGGGMGEVWRAQHRLLVRPAAIKIIRPDVTRALSGTEAGAMRARFEREVQLTALLTSPHTVAIYDFGSTEDGRLYYVMELLHGLDAESLVERFGPLPAERVIYLLRQACESLGEAHHAGLVHRDIKPANLHLCMIGGKSDFVKVLDFGLVRDLGSSVRLTGDGLISGTPAYLAPETAASNVTGPRSDIYSLGCVAYWMLTGRLVFEGQTSAAMLAAHLRDDVVPPSSRTELPVPPALDELVLECLSKNPDARPQTMDEMRRRLDAVPLERRWDQTRAQAWWNAHAPDVVSEASDASKRGRIDKLPRG